MRLVRLEFEGIGSFAERMEVDFATLADSGLFLIEGPTGSGKSTILDAIVFALYGSVAGSASDDGRLDSHLRHGTPFVELEFVVGGQTYRVRRSPAHERRKRRGEGTTAQSATATLMRLGDGDQTLATRASEVAENIGRIVGLTKKQFVATVVLAQGEFAAFLDADTGRRAQILERVFGTEFYKDVEDQLHVMRHEARNRRAYAEAALTAAVHECIGLLDVPIDDADPLTDIDRAVAAIQAHAEAVQADLAAAEQRLAAAQSALTEGEALLGAQRRKREAMQRAEEVESRRSRIEQWQQSLAAHDRAMPVMPAMEATAVVRARHAAAQDSLRTHLGYWRFDDRDADLEERERLERTLAELLHPQQVEVSLGNLRSATVAAGEALADAESTLNAARAESQTLADHRQRLSEQLQELPDAGARIAHVNQALAEARVRAEAAEQLTCEEQRLRAATEAADSAEADALAAEQERERAVDLRRLDLAAELADTLQDGQACLVCGSRSHPDPAMPNAPIAVPEIPALTAAATARRDAAREARRLADRLAGTVEALRARVQGLPDADGLPVEQLRQEHANLVAQAQRREALRKDLDDAGAALQNAQERVTRAAVSAEACRAKVQSSQAILDEADNAVAAARGGYPTVAARVADLTVQRDLVVQILTARSEVANQQVALQEAEGTLRATLVSAGFADEQQVLKGRLELEQYQQRVDAVQQWQADCEQARAVLRELAEVDLEQEVDLARAEAQVARAREHVSQVQARLGTLTDRLERAVPARGGVANHIERVREVRSSTDAVIRMADLATAARSEVVHKVRLSSFVLMRRFEDVVNAANDRLDAISEGRYQLVVEAHGLDNRGQAGLDLRVYDGRSDTCRSTGSLSGGERFYVSLALALGLADVVRGESGGVELGTLFIDEGFGSLDHEVLDEVMDMLEQVRVGEDRVIGLISHVDILKQRIDPRISVRRDPRRPGVSTLSVHA